MDANLDMYYSRDTRRYVNESPEVINQYYGGNPRNEQYTVERNMWEEAMYEKISFLQTR